MAVWSEVPIGTLFGDFRLDAECYTPELINAYEHLAGLKCVRLGDHAYVTDGQHGYHKIDSESPIRHLTAKCVKDFFIDDTNAERLALETHLKNLRSSCEVGDVLLSTAGTLGNAAIVTEEVLPANMDQDVARIHLRDDAIDPWYLVAFLDSRVGRLQSERVSTGQVQKHIALEKIREFSVPVNFSQRRAADAVRRAHKSLCESNDLYREAEESLLTSLGVACLDLSPQLFYERRYSDAETAHRLDAEYFQPKYERLLTLLKDTGNAFRLGDLLGYCQRGFQPAYEATGDVLVINSEHVGKRHVELEGNRRTTRAFVEKNRGRGVVRKYDVLLNSTGYVTIGRAQTLLCEADAIVDSHVTILRTKEGLDPVFLGLFLNSMPGFLQTERGWTGSSGQIELRLDVIKDFTVWAAPAETQARIRQGLEASEAARQESQRLLTEAKRMVESMVLAGPC